MIVFDVGSTHGGAEKQAEVIMPITASDRNFRKLHRNNILIAVLSKKEINATTDTKTQTHSVTILLSKMQYIAWYFATAFGFVLSCFCFSYFLSASLYVSKRGAY